jgi:drug/metabolite transporter (DMT)-like permease
LPLAALLGDRVTGRAVLGVLVALGGVWLLIWAG